MQKQAYVFIENEAIVPIENSMYVVYHDPTKRSFKYDQKTKQIQQISVYNCKLRMRLLLCQDAIFHRMPIPSDIETQRTCPNYIDQLVLDRQGNDLWIKRQPVETEIGPRCKLPEHELVQDEYLRHLRPYENLGQIFWQEKLDKSNHQNLQQISRETKSDKMQKFRREIEF